MRNKSADPVFKIVFRYRDKDNVDVVLSLAVRAQDEMNARIWIQRVTTEDCKLFGDLAIYKSNLLYDCKDIPHILDLEDVSKVIAEKESQADIATQRPPAVVVPVKEYSIADWPWAQELLIIPGKGLGTTKNSHEESFYEAAKGAYDL
jgi:hypothetical protein